MGTSPSTTDIEQVKLAASTGPYYLTVITNNKLDFTAKVAIESETQLKGYSFFKNLTGKKIKSKEKVFKKKTYEIIECEVEIQKPDYMQAIDTRIATKLQMYQHGGGIGKENHLQGTHKTVAPYTYNSNKSKRSADWWEKHYGGYNGYAEIDYSDGDSYEGYGTQKTIGFPTATTTPASKIEVDKDTIIKILREYCLDNSGDLLPLDVCILNLISDAKDYGLGLDDYLKCLRSWKVFNELDEDNSLLMGIERFQKELEKDKATNKNFNS